MFIGRLSKIIGGFNSKCFLMRSQSSSVLRLYHHHRILPHNNNLKVHPEVELALRTKQPVVALESTIITHGMPHPQNVETALEVEKIVRSHGVTPATIGILDGCIKVGLTEAELLELSKKPHDHVIKCSRRDLPYILAMKQSGGTTVAATMMIAHSVGIQIFATGGIGGVHRDGHITMDISADLVELGRTPVVVVSSGIKSILDIPRTLEYLETHGVCVATYGSDSGIFPDFYTRDSGCTVPYNIATAAGAADVIYEWQRLKMQSGMLIAVPIPKEFAANKREINEAIVQAEELAAQDGVRGKEVTPYLLASIANITRGQSLIANMALIKHNAKVAAQIAKELTQFTNCKPIRRGKPVVIGASILDLSFTINDHEKDMELQGATYTAASKQTAGGVGRNLAEAIFKLYGDVYLISAIGNDHLGQSLIKMIPSALQTNLIIDHNMPTSLCSVIFDKMGDCKLILGNMEIHRSITPDHIANHTNLFEEASLIVIDSNLSMETIEATLKQAKQHKLPVVFEPTDMFIAGKPFNIPIDLSQFIRLITPNIHELKTIVETITKESVKWQPTINIDLPLLLTKTTNLMRQIAPKFNCIIVTLGEHGVLISLRSDAVSDIQKLLDTDVEISNETPLTHHVRFYAAPKVDNITNVSGAGDSFSAGFITGILQERSLDGCVALGFLAAERALQSDSAVPGQYYNDCSQFEQKYNQIQDSLKMKII